MKTYFLKAVILLLMGFAQNLNAETHFWSGTVNQFWGTAANWDTGTVPGPDDDVFITSGAPYECMISISDRQCNNLYIMSNTSLTVYDEELTVNGNMYIYGTLIMNNQNGKIWVYNNIIWYSGSQANISAWAPIKLWGNWEFRSGSHVHLSNGFVEFLGTNNTNIKCNSPDSYFHSLDLTYSHTVSFNTASTTPLVINNNLKVGTNTIFYSACSQNIILNGQLILNGDIHFANGTFVYQGNYSSVTGLSISDYFHNLTINSGTFNCDGIIQILKDLTINGGTLSPNALYIYGNWINNAGQAAFDEGTGYVRFTGSAIQSCSNETFYDLKIDKSGGYMIPQQGTTIYIENNTYIYSGKIQMSTNSTLQFDGGLYFTDGAHIDATGATGVTFKLYGGYTDDNNTTQSGFIPGTSTAIFKMDISYNMVYSDAPTMDFYNIVKTGSGSIRFVCDIKIFNDLTISEGAWSHFNNTFNRYFYGDITIDNDAQFKDKNNLIFVGDYLHSLDFSNNNLVLGNISVVGSKNNNSKSGKSLTLQLSSNSSDPLVYVFDDIVVENGTFQLDNHLLKTIGNININDGGEFILSKGSGLLMSTGKQLTVNSGGYFKSVGTPEEKILISQYNSDDYYGFKVKPGGTISAKHTTFEYMNTNGIRVEYGSTIDEDYPFDYCTFRCGQANGTFLYINALQDLTIANAVFKDNINGSIYNIFRDLNFGSVTFAWASGDFEGETYEYDYYGNVYWDYTPALVAAKVFLEGPFNGSTMETDLNSNLPLSQPYYTSPWNYNGNETVTSITNPNIVDWVLVELRTSTQWASTTTNESTVARKAAFLLNDGTIIDVDNNTDIPFNTALGQNESFFLVVKHRNHLGILSAWALTLSGGVYNYDFSTGPGQVVGTNQGHKYLGNGTWGMYAGDGNSDGVINFNDNSNPWQLQAGGTGYLQSDCNMDTQADNKDKNDFWFPNLWESSQIPE